jgi:hypothetical protein
MNERLAPLPSPAEITPIRPDVLVVPPRSPGPLQGNLVRFPTEHARPGRPYIPSPESSGPDQIDYTDIPLPTERQRAGTTALHESHHVLIASSLGIPVDRVSIIPGPGYLGVTVFKGDLRHRPHALQLIAAGGAVDTLQGKAEGFGHSDFSGSDMHIAHSVSASTGVSAADAVRHAAERLTKIPENVRRIVADIIETKRIVYSPALINRIIDIAYFETKNGVATAYLEEIIAEEEIARTEYSASIDQGYTTTIITPTDGNTYVIVEENKNPLDENNECPNCKSKDGHAASCKQKEEENIKKRDFQTGMSEKPVLPTTADIFERENHLRVIK